MIIRKKELKILKQRLIHNPIVGLSGVRQCGKTTLARQQVYSYYFDLENPRDFVRLDQPQLALEDLNGLIVIDEIQRKKELFPLLRYLVDNNPQQKYLILGSASRELIKQSSESLAGRISYYQLSVFNLIDINFNFKKLWLRGGYPKAYLADSNLHGIQWRRDYISTFLERDIPQLGIQIPAQTLRRFWKMLAHYHGQTVNYSEFSRSFGISDTRIKKYLEILQGTFMVRLLQPWYINIKKRLVKAPKLYLTDSGIFHTLMEIENYDQLTSHNKLGASWEGFVIQQLIDIAPFGEENFYFWATHNGAELDLYWQFQAKNWGVEIKYHDAPKITKSMKIALDDLQLTHLWVIYPGTEKYQLDQKITVLPISQVQQVFKPEFSS